ncbi:MAG: LysE family translocator [Chloroflexi bacterium]|jgi:threonine/homoserine/homoserine lactone efflux protein|uniref:RhtB family transporter n=1 Tax=Candidatus Thermofonsia Clade 3 bacterium TaxID=2364212 RepID=A0A2M8QG34_9CHLR|nr:LysE family translocator [Candidatus Roseilinea sp. NK_OTU-006]PJF48773.1 MAG: RhtB family transporter [Candidatus Thermofonsia Clade 3 bacterium]RMG63604.1 MAG: LysE family translocator [Chloroflexota bacterium]
MLQPVQIQLFVLASLALLVAPGPAVLYIVARSVSQGRLAGMVSAAGVQVGALVHIVAAALGLSAVLLSSALAFNAVKYLGAAYLIYLGARQWRTREPATGAPATPRESLQRVFAQGVVVNALNPKTALFFFAFLPQFVDPAQGDVAAQVLLLGLLFVALAMVNDGAYALLAGSLGNWLRGNRRFWRGQRIFAGAVCVGLGVMTALSGSRSP